MTDSGNRCFDGITAVCPVCKVKFYICVPEMWAYKLEATNSEGQRSLLYFNKHSCKRKFEADYENEKVKRRSNAAKKRHNAQREKDGSIPKEPRRWDGKHCADCDNCKKDSLGLYECVARQISINPHKMACSKYIEPEEHENV